MESAGRSCSASGFGGPSASRGKPLELFIQGHDALRRLMPLRAKLKATTDFSILVAHRAKELSWES